MGSNVPCEASCVTVKTSFAGVNYADVCVRWGLYESARKYVRERVRCAVCVVWRASKCESVCGVYAVCVWCGAVWCGVLYTCVRVYVCGVRCAVCVRCGVRGEH